MKNLIVSVLCACAWVGVVLADSPGPSNDPAVVNGLKQLEQDLGDAMVRVDIDKLNQIYADHERRLGGTVRISRNGSRA